MTRKCDGQLGPDAAAQAGGTHNALAVAGPIESFLRAFSHGFSSELSRAMLLEASLLPFELETLPIDVYESAAGEPTLRYVLAVDSHFLCLDFSPESAFAIIDRLVGGDGQGPLFVPDRSLTEIERGVLGRAARLGVEALRTAWPGDASTAELRETLGDAAWGDGGVLAVRFPLQLAARQGVICLALPESLVQSLASGSAVQASPQAEVEISVDIDGPSVDAAELAALSVGDIVTSDVDAANGEVIVRVDGRPRFAARLGTRNGKRAITITRVLDDAGD